MSKSIAAVVVGGGVGGLALLTIVIGFIWSCMQHCKNFANRNSDTGSSEPYAMVELSKGVRSSYAARPSLSGPQGTRQFTLEELQQATRHFSESNLIGSGSFGLVYKGLLCDGIIVAIKRRPGAPGQQFVEEVCRLSDIRHRHLVTLLGCCQEDGLQMLLFEYLPNGTVCNHLYDKGEVSRTQLEFKQRLSIALGAAKGICHLHGLSPPLAHRDFKTSKVLVDENFIAKVADAGISSLLERIEDASSSSRMTVNNVFRDPEIGEFGTPAEMSDVYSFGVFLLELITGREAQHFDLSESDESLTQWVELHASSKDLVDRRLGNTFTTKGMDSFIKLMQQCLRLTGRKRPKMDVVVRELDRILENEMTLTTVMGEGTAIVTLGSQLFTST
ncbi:proline-rich receptor-like protein kinase PERK13 isoform X2 [Cinnamomum micranthum f. kanehirae]|uniref:non-specific serine/threonine protein kinase n=1 Tax=Cinnamomum micranthum f. kanehirae TaxID=337451 RepID=A0A443PV77_9MAGN|nr:proline-rich receptor-like protein kinase PERK13 isoform X2 [Cinnamomum micranthum f. kanehirae]